MINLKDPKYSRYIKEVKGQKESYFKVGDEVVLVYSGHRKYYISRSNPIIGSNDACVGIVDDIECSNDFDYDDNDYLPVSVRWGKLPNTYHLGTLMKYSDFLKLLGNSKFLLRRGI